MNTASSSSPLSVAIVGAGPVGLAFGLQLSRLAAGVRIHLFDARALQTPLASDPRTLALSLGSVQALQRLKVWDAIAPHSAAIREVHVSQQQPALLGLPPGRAREPQLILRAEDERVPQLGAVARYDAVLAPLLAAWRSACEREPQRLSSRFGTRVQAIKALARGVELDAGVVEGFDHAVVAEGGLFEEQNDKALSHTYRQTAWVGEVELAGGRPGVAHERFTRQGPAALLPLPSRSDGVQRAALVWCVRSDDDPVAELDADQRRRVLNTVFAPGSGNITAVSELKSFALGLNAETRLVQARTVRIGNAAQTLHPVAGQGLNLGLRDVHVLATRLAAGGDLDAALRSVQWQRLPDRWATVALTDFLARSFTWEWPGLGTLRGLGLAALSHLPPLKSRLARRMMFGWR